MMDSDKVEKLARLLHESGREAVEQRKIYRDDLPVKPFAEWDELSDAAREGRFMMARFLLAVERRIELLNIFLPEVARVRACLWMLDA